MIIGRFYYNRNSEQLEEPIPQTPKRDNPAKTKKNNPGKTKKKILEKKKHNPGKKKKNPGKTKKKQKKKKKKKHQKKTFFRKSRGGGLTSGFLEDFPKIGLFGVFGVFVFGFLGFSRIAFFLVFQDCFFGFSFVIESPNNYIL